MSDTTTISKTPKITDHVTYAESPYSVDLYVRQYAPKEEDEYIFTGEDGESYAAYKIPKNKTVVFDPRKYSKLFQGNSELLLRLSDPAMKMFLYISENLRVNKDEICIFKDEFLVFAGFNPKNKVTYYRALDGLLTEKVIARKAGSTTCFFINPNIIFNGDRTKLSNTVVKTPTNKI